MTKTVRVFLAVALGLGLLAAVAVWMQGVAPAAASPADPAPAKRFPIEPGRAAPEGSRTGSQLTSTPAAGHAPEMVNATIILSEGFEVSVPPPGWTQQMVVNAGTPGTWAAAAGTVHPCCGGTHGGSWLAYFNSYDASSGSATRLYVTNLDFTADETYQAAIWVYHDQGYTNGDRLQLEVDSGSGWINVGVPIYRYDGTMGWAEHTVDLTAYAGEVISLSLKGISGFGNDLHVDDLTVSRQPRAPFLEVVKVADRLVAGRGETLTYTVVLSNVGSAAATGVVLTDTLDAAQRPQSVSASGGSCDVADPGWGGAFTCDLGGLGINAPVVVTLSAQTTASLPLAVALPRITNTVQVAADGGVSATGQTTVLLDTCQVQLVEDGSATSFATVQAAIDAASSDSAEVQVSGACFGVELRGGQYQVAYIDKTLTLRGGYSPDFALWDPAQYPAALHALGQGRVLYLTGEDNSPRVQSLYLTGGDAGDEDGGGVYVERAAATILDCQVVGNSSDSNGGGLLALYAPVTISGCQISENVAYAGAGLFLDDSDAVISGNTVAHNRALGWVAQGGGLFLDNCEATVSDNTVVGNSAEEDGGGLYLEYGANVVRNNTISGNSSGEDGGGLMLDDTDSTFSGNQVTDNQAVEKGGGIYLYQGGVSLYRNAVSGNQAGIDGGGFYLEECDGLLDATAVLSNSAAVRGGGLALEESDPTLDNTLVAGNSAGLWGAGLYVYGSSPVLRHTTVARNTGGDGSGVYVTDSAAYWSEAVLTNTLVASQTAGIWVDWGNQATLEATVWGSGAWASGADWAGLGTVATGALNLWGDPDFVDPESGDFHIGPGSAAVDAGLDLGVLEDVDGDPRPAGFGFDAGADERPGAVLRVAKTPGRPAVNAGGMLTYSIRVTNAGAVAGTGVRLTDTLPVQQSPLAAGTSQGSCAAGSGWGAEVVCPLGDVEAGQAAAITLTVQVTDVQPGPLPYRMTNRVQARADNALGAASEDVFLYDCHVRVNGVLPEYTDVQAGLDAAAEGDTVMVAGVCAGLNDRGGVRQVAYLDKTVTLRGGYRADFAAWDPALYPTTLHATGHGRVVYITGDGAPVVESLILTGGDASGLGSSLGPDSGGGVYISAQAAISGCQVLSNTAWTGGGVYLEYADATLVGNTIQGNQAAFHGGGLASYYAYAGVSGNLFSGNAGQWDGGGLYLDTTSGQIVSNTMAGNSTDGDGGGLFVTGGDLAVVGNQVVSNTAGYCGGGVYLANTGSALRGNQVSHNTADDGGGLCLTSANEATLAGNQVSENTAQGLSAYGGGAYVFYSDARLFGNAVTGNQALGNFGRGGGLYLYYSDITADANTVEGNQASGYSGYGGGLYLYDTDVRMDNSLVIGNQVGKTGAGLYVDRSSTHLRHTTLARNTGGDGSGIYVTGSSLTPATAYLTNTVLVSQTVGVYVATTYGSARLEATLWGSGSWANGANWGGPGSVSTGAINLMQEPGFVDAAAGDYHLDATSAAIDAGVDTGVFIDVDGDARPAGLGYDLGADERPGAVLRVHKRGWQRGVNVGQVLSYTVVIHNVGVETATQVLLTDTLPAEQRPLAADAGQAICIPASGWGGKTTCALGEIQPGAAAVVTLTAEMTSTTPGPLFYPMHNQVQVIADNAFGGGRETVYLHDCHVRVNGAPPEYTAVQAGLDAASEGDTVMVAGVCTGVTGRGGPVPSGAEGSRQVALVDQNVTLRGGYSTDFSAWDPETHPTLLHALGEGRVLRIEGPVTPTIESLRLTGGDATGLGGRPAGIDAGGGVYLIEASATLSDCQIFSNTARYGAGVYLFESAATLGANEVMSNTAAGPQNRGGGLYLYQSDATLAGSLDSASWVRSNTAESGAGLFLDHSDARLSWNAVVSNTAGGNGGGLYLWSSRAWLSYNLLAWNSAGSTGGGMRLDSSDAIVESSVFFVNDAMAGGALYLYNSAPTVRGNYIVSNTAFVGGAMDIFDSSPLLDNNVIVGNQADEASALYIGDSFPLLRHNTFARNSSGTSAGIFVDQPWAADTRVVMSNTILVSHTLAIHVEAGSTAVLEGTLWGSGAWANLDDWDGPGTIDVGTINLWGDPDFVAPDVFDYHLGAGSEAIDRGIDAGVTDDIDGDRRPAGAGYDLGADEYPAELVLVKWAKPAEVAAGSRLTYTIALTNSGAMTLTATVTDRLPAQVVPTGEQVWPTGAVAPGKTWRQTLVVTVQAGYSGTLTNVVWAMTDLGTSAAFTETSRAYLCNALQSVQVAGPAAVTVGRSATLTATVAPADAATPVDYTWQASGLGTVSHSGGLSDVATLSWTVTGQQAVTVTAVNGCGGAVTGYHSLVVTNLPPVADAGPDQSVAINQVMMLDGTGSSDPDGHLPLAYGWQQTGGQGVVLDDPASATPSFTAPGSPAVLTFTLAVTDSQGLADPTPDQVVVTVNEEEIGGLTADNSSPTTLGQATAMTATVLGGSNVSYAWAFGDGQQGAGRTTSHTYGAAGFYTAAVTASNSAGQMTATTRVTITNLAPVANAGPDQSVWVGDPVTLDGSGSTDPDGHLPLSYGWQQTGGPTAALDNPASATPSFTAPDTPAVLTFTLAVTDSQGLADPTPDQVVVTVNEEEIGGLTADNSSPTTLGPATALTATVAAGSNVSYAWAFGDGQQGAGQTTSHTYGAARFYTATITASNSAGQMTATTRVTITNLAPVANAGPDQMVWVGDPVTLDGSGSADPDAHLPLVYGWQQTGGPAAALDDPASATPSFTAPDTPAVLTFTLAVTDSTGLADPTPDQVVINVASECTALTAVGIIGPSEGITGTAYTFAGVYTPAAATPIVLLTWLPEPLSGQGTASANYRWDVAGTYTVTLWAENCGGPVQTDHRITIGAEAPPRRLFLPVVMRGYAGRKAGIKKPGF